MDFFLYPTIDEDTACIGICYHNKKKCYEEDLCADHEKGYPLNVVAGTIRKSSKTFSKIIYVAASNRILCIQ